MSTKVIIELIVDNEAFYSGTDENIKNYIIEIQKLTKTFSYVKECNIVSIVREGGRLGHVITDDLGKLKNTLKIFSEIMRGLKRNAIDS